MYNKCKENIKKQVKTLHLGEKMYCEMNNQISFMQYTFKDEFTLNSNNRWVKKAEMVPWKMAEEKYSHMFRKHGRPAKDIRMALGALIIQSTLKTFDEETVEQIAENPYLQYFIGLQKFVDKCPFDSSLLVWFRKRILAKFIAEINEIMCKEAARSNEETKTMIRTIKMIMKVTP